MVPPIDLRRQPVAQRLGSSIGVAVDREHDVARLAGPALAAGPPSSTVETSAPCGLRQAERLGDLGGHRLKAGADPGPLEMVAAGLGRVDHGPHHVGRDGEADADRAAAAAR